MSLNVRVITPDRIVWDANAEELILPSSTGQLGILTDHAPLLTALDIGVMRLKTGGNWISFVLMEGFAEVEDNKITILCNANDVGHRWCEERNILMVYENETGTSTRIRRAEYLKELKRRKCFI